MVYIWPNTISTFHGDREIALAAGYIEISDELYADLVETKKMWKNGKIVNDKTYPERKKKQEEEEAERQARQIIIDEINELKRHLSETDYIAIKHSEGWISEEDYAETKAQRQAWRDRINELENDETETDTEAK